MALSMTTANFNPTFHDVEMMILARSSIDQKLRAYRVSQIRVKMTLLLKATRSNLGKHKSIQESYDHLEGMVRRMVFDTIVFDTILRDLEERIETALQYFELS